jgi:hypothetical protein
MAIIKKVKRKNKQELEQFINLKNLLTSNLEWCKWAGWMDTDGAIQVLKHKDKNKANQIRVSLGLRDKQPVELLSDFFETNLMYREFKTITPEPYRNEYIAKVYHTNIYGNKAFCITKNIYPYLLNDAKKQFAIKVLGYEPESKPLDDWTKQEFVSYFATVVEGDGGILLHQNKKSKRIRISIKSSTIEYLCNLKYLLEKLFDLNTNLVEKQSYQTLNGLKTKYDLYINTQDSEIYNLLVAPNIMTLDRKKNKILEFVNQ